MELLTKGIVDKIRKSGEDINFLNKILDGDYIYLGLRNDWTDIPDQLKNCKHTLHGFYHNTSGSCNIYACHECKICWEVDSSD